MKMLVFEGDQGGSVREQQIPELLLAEAQLWRERLLEPLYECSDQMLELALQEAEIPVELIHRVLRDATLGQIIQPVLCGTALHGIGVQPVLDGVSRYLPSPLDRPPVEGHVPATKKSAEPETTTRQPDPEDPFCGLVFKVLPARTGDLTWVRIYSGSLKANSRIYNPGRDVKDNVSQLWQIHATRKESQGQVDAVQAGDIVGIIGLRKSVTGDTLCDAREPLVLESIDFPETVISMAIEPETATERNKLAETLELITRQDPTLQVVSGDTGQTLLCGMGELHLEVIKNRLRREFDLDIKFHKPQVSYRETVQRSVEVVGQCNRQIAGQLKSASLTLRMEPIEGQNQGVEVRNLATALDIPRNILGTIIEELHSCGQGGGPVAGFALMCIQVSLLDVEVAEEGSDEVAFRIAVNDAFEKGLQQAKPVLLEPIMKINITTPDAYLGEFVSDLQQRRAIIVQTENHGDRAEIEAHAPLKELFGYSNAMRSLSQGRASCSIEPLHYAPAPESDLAIFKF
jgi:elongation factor G